ncbi:hypothetical protein MesoLjLc_71460 [Mesorhizobium sp. L-8-10]|uniref:hypothetical protein n=1 Tax=unclassified Mesorhizobium TaxID=325217 RepID=UPI001926A77E|nr:MULTISPECIES: hypothetical protein [unclassified Mesorhizobium]BCH27260.1 hypothetical protein MesoLjLb_70450 [Mesorhizobium sp. L-8-3]BCH35216.1 hypothetical protein MesoLjLc_71460 [Mesorhizobium sp. L-8-10]
MSAAITSRLAALEAARPPASMERRVVTVVSGEGQEAAVRKLLRSHGLDPKAGNLLIIRRCIVSAPAEEPYREPPYLLGFGEQPDGL